MSDNSSILSLNDKLLDEVDSVSTILTVTKNSCLEKECNSKYYGLSLEKAKSLSSERNDYINIINILFEKISNIRSLNTSIENELVLQQYPNNSCR